jgi:sulfur-carrier protein
MIVNGTRNPMSTALSGAHPVSVVVELYGVPRMRAGRRQYQVRATCVGDAMAALERECPQLSGSVLANGWPLSAYRLSLNGQFFVSNPALQLAEGDALVLIAADAGG